MIKKYWDRLRQRIAPFKLRRYGTCGLSFTDDRTLLEKVCDYIDKWFKTQEIRATHTRRTAFEAFFDRSLGIQINSMSDIRKIERERGMTYISLDDIESENAKKARRKEEQFDRDIEHGVVEAVHRINEGHSYVKEALQRQRAQGR